MTAIDTGITGAKRQSYRKASPRDLLKRLIDDNGRATEKSLRSKFASAVRDDEDYIDAIIEYWFANNYRYLFRKAPIAPAARAEKAARHEALKSQIKVAATRMVLLDVILPVGKQGKALRDCTGKECESVGPKMGAWITRIAKAIKPAQKVGETLSEAAVRKLFRS